MNDVRALSYNQQSKVQEKRNKDYCETWLWLVNLLMQRTQ
jgi:hypothetical protein